MRAIHFVGLAAGRLAGKTLRGTGFGIIGAAPSSCSWSSGRCGPAGGLGAGSGVLLDVNGEIGRVSMSEIPVPLPRQAEAESAPMPAPAAN